MKATAKRHRREAYQAAKARRKAATAKRKEKDEEKPPEAGVGAEA